MVTKRISSALAIAAFFLVAAATIKHAQGLGFIGAEAAKRTIQVITGLVLAVYGNFMPKHIAPFRATTRAQSALRVGGWSMTLAGLGHAGFWAFAPVAFAHVAAMAVVAAATLVTAGYGGWIALTCKWRTQGPSI